MELLGTIVTTVLVKADTGRGARNWGSQQPSGASEEQVSSSLIFCVGVKVKRSSRRMESVGLNM